MLKIKPDPTEIEIKLAVDLTGLKISRGSSWKGLTMSKSSQSILSGKCVSESSGMQKIPNPGNALVTSLIYLGNPTFRKYVIKP